MSKSAKQVYSKEDLMKLAIEESRKSMPEHADKTDPRVGAIIVNAEGEILARAHRGELRIGEHCEFTLIERKLRNQNLRGCVLYVTLEPCTDASRKSPKRGCSSHIIKARLSEVYVGVEDPNPNIATEGIKFLESKGIKVHMFPEHLAQIIREDNARFISEKEQEAMQARQAPIEVPKGMLKSGAPGTTIQNLSAGAIQTFIERSNASFTFPSDPFNQWMIELQLAEKSLNGEIVPTGLGLMLFGAHPENVFPQTVFKVEINYGPGETEIRDFKGPLIQQLPEILSFVTERALKLTVDRRQAVRAEHTDFPADVLREAIANAIIHRDYTIEGATNYLYIGVDRIMVRSPGGPFAPLTLNDLRTLDTPSFNRNPKIMFIFNQMKLAEQRGIGLRNMKELPGLGFPLPVFSLVAGSLEVLFGRTVDSIAASVGAGKKLNKEEQAGILFLQERGEATAAEYAAHLHLTPKTAQRRLARLMNLNLVETTSGKRWTKYKSKAPSGE